MVAARFGGALWWAGKRSGRGRTAHPAARRRLEAFGGSQGRMDAAETLRRFRGRPLRKATAADDRQAQDASAPRWRALGLARSDGAHDPWARTNPRRFARHLGCAHARA